MQKDDKKPSEVRKTVGLSLNTLMPKEKLLKKVNIVTREWYRKRLGGFFHRRRKALLFLDSRRTHVTDSVKAAIRRTNSVPAVIPGVQL